MTHHVRKQLRAAIATALGALPTTGARVFPGRTWPNEQKDYPALLIWARGGTSAFEAMGSNDASVILERDEKIVVEGIVRATGGESSVSVDDLLDAIALEVEPAMMTAAGVGALVDRRELIDTVLDAQVGGDARVGSIRLTYRIVYATPAGAPDTKI